MKHYLIYLPDATSKEEEHLQEMQKLFGRDNVYPLGKGGAFAVKVTDDFYFEKLMEKAGFTADKKKNGIAVKFDNSNINGWYANDFWEFIQREPRHVA